MKPYLILIGLSMMGCQQKVEYMTAEIKGQVIDRMTEQPISNVKVMYSSGDFDISDEKGQFLIPPAEYHYRVSPPKRYEYGYYNYSSLMFMADGYKLKSYAVGDLPTINATGERTVSSYEEKRYIDMGKVYLTAKDAGGGEIQEEYIEGPIAYCQPHQSQKTTECIPLPAALSHTQEPHTE
ncbi:carboxypeptidase-like regulatory domain-containing protein [Psychrobacter sp. I-STPA6b]|uniref:carboxypeptidase-like regulatory domain-containing protein n=1 Tax=Psychrobacter sp. I-STPA6b TaxID=2585718 RepID=UPI001D0CC512|nr:carboxypeptidase-like regulatory domain-containing protein [Psychrobacter sp. I-STPA6b]